MQWLAVARINLLFGNYKKYTEYGPTLFFYISVSIEVSSFSEIPVFWRVTHIK